MFLSPMRDDLTVREAGEVGEEPGALGHGHLAVGRAGRQRRRKGNVVALQRGQRHGDDGRLGAQHLPSVGAAHLHAATRGTRQQSHRLDSKVGSDGQATRERRHRIVKAGAFEHQVFLAMCPVPLLVDHLVQSDIRHVGTVIVGEDGVREVEHARRQAARRKVLKERLLGQGGGGRDRRGGGGLATLLLLAEPLKRLVHRRNVWLLVCIVG